MSTPEIPTHDFYRDNSDSISFRLIPLAYKSEYDTSVPHRHNYFEIFVFAEGGGEHDVDFATFPIRDRSIHFVSPGQVHQVRRALRSCGHVLLFSRDFFFLHHKGQDLLFDLPFLHGTAPVPVVEVGEPDWVLFNGLIRQMEEEVASASEPSAEILRSYLSIFLVQASRRATQEGPRPDRAHLNLLKQLHILLEQNFRDLHQVREYASLMGISEKALNEVTKRELGKTALEAIHDRIVLEARRLLFHSELSNKEIAHFLNFDDPSHFSKFFKRKMGLSPSAYRQQIREEFGGKS